MVYREISPFIQCKENVVLNYVLIYIQLKKICSEFNEFEYNFVQDYVLIMYSNRKLCALILGYIFLKLHLLHNLHSGFINI